MFFVCHPKILHKHCLQFLLGVKMAPRETENNAYAKFWGDKQRTLWYVMVFMEWSIPNHLVEYFITWYPLVLPSVCVKRSAGRVKFFSTNVIHLYIHSFLIHPFVRPSIHPPHSFISLLGHSLIPIRKKSV